MKQLYCSRKGDKLLEFVSGGQRERISRAYESVSASDVESYFKVMGALHRPAGTREEHDQHQRRAQHQAHA